MSELIPDNRLLVCGSREEVKSVVKRTRDFLTPHLGTITPRQLHQIAHDEGEAALEEYKRKRYVGELFDIESRGPGVLVFAPWDTIEHIKNHYLIFHNVELPEGVDSRVNQRLWKMNLENGVYRLAMWGIEVRAEIESNKSVGMEKNQVVRIEGKNGELWQNKNYTWDGTPKKSPMGYF